MPMDLVYPQDTPTMPADYAASLDEVAPGISGIVAQQNMGDENWWDTLLRSLPIITTTVQQQQVLQLQIDRAKQGLPPLPVDQLGNPVAAPSGITPGVLLLGLGVGAFLLLRKG